MEKARRQRSRTFEGVASLYDTHRPGYPAALFDDLAAIAGLDAGSNLLEIGCGSGLATTGLAERGFAVTAIDPGPTLIDLARRRLDDYPNIMFTVATFEDWPLPTQAYDLVAAAQSWHWVRPEIRFAKAAQALRPGGHLAVFGHTPLWSNDLIARLAPVYGEHAPELVSELPEDWYLPAGPLPGLFAQSGAFAPAHQRSYRWSLDYSASSFVAYLATRSDHNILPADRRRALLSAVEAVLAAGTTLDWATNLYVAARLP